MLFYFLPSLLNDRRIKIKEQNNRCFVPGLHEGGVESKSVFVYASAKSRSPDSKMTNTILTKVFASPLTFHPEEFVLRSNMNYCHRRGEMKFGKAEVSFRTTHRYECLKV
ncbi:hypothetical protein NPIL_435581 [Nephila pilipes]|uniref:Uncharacterized protein n=1 Tax=Nephila pilipes TaxID=299642 RepID=A0A8X6PXJ4_NEPPI|nr:hypothetical protein NPIL_435581 [Nephila pilipes]